MHNDAERLTVVRAYTYTFFNRKSTS